MILRIMTGHRRTRFSLQKGLREPVFSYFVASVARRRVGRPWRQRASSSDRRPRPPGGVRGGGGGVSSWCIHAKNVSQIGIGFPSSSANRGRSDEFLADLLVVELKARKLVTEVSIETVRKALERCAEALAEGRIVVHPEAGRGPVRGVDGAGSGRLRGAVDRGGADGLHGRSGQADARETARTRSHFP